ncbi:F-box domain-containing protein [Mycena chlorophos]|uniref:F-box domain-containing protein n=1 Tax=Mycena chlorophos TaxID=658473 RepID=A0A8H6TK80_MYCCL|nr:F-box domain-containing protein [Mycena chlorophos]
MSGWRQSARLSAAKAQKGASTSKVAQAGAKGGTSDKHAGNKESISDDNLDEPEDEDEEMDSGSDVEYGKPPPGKKQKLDNSGQRGILPRSTDKNKNENECLLVKMPVNILFEIFGLCPPQDLLSLSCASHSLRTHLLSQTDPSRGIWKAAREYAQGPPVGPGMTESQWARLIFGKPWCQSCGAPNVQRVDFRLQRRACTTCLKENLVVTSEFKSTFPDIEPSILDLLRHTNIGANGRASKSRWYWHEDVEDMVRELESIERGDHVRVRGALKKEAFIAGRKKLVKAISEHAKICGEWKLTAAHRRQEEKNELSRQRYNDLKAKFIELGYVEADINSIKGQKVAEQPTPLTERDWERVRSPLEKTIEAAKSKRLYFERKAVVDKRRNVAEGLYNKYRRSIVPSQWRSLPPLWSFLAKPVFKDILEAADDLEVTELHFQPALDSLPAMVLSLQTGRSAHLLELIQTPPTTPAQADAEPGEILPSPPHPYSLDSALAVFVCEQKCKAATPPGSSGSPIPAYVGHEAAAAHHCRGSYYSAIHGHYQTVFQLSKGGVLAASALLKSVGFDDKATCAQMDTLDARFVCQVCPARKVSGKLTYWVYPWRAAITHFAHTHQTKPCVPQWELLDPARTELVKGRETDSTLSWACNHCAQHAKQCETRAKVVQHVESIHAISNPSVAVDFFRLVDLDPIPATLHIPKEVMPPPPPLQDQYNCLQCAGEKPSARARLFILKGVKTHLKEKHKVDWPMEGRDWRKVPKT